MAFKQGKAQIPATTNKVFFELVWTECTDLIWWSRQETRWRMFFIRERFSNLGGSGRLKNVNNTFSLQNIMALLLWLGLSLLASVQASAVKNCHPGCRCEVESFGLFDSFSLTRVDCRGLGPDTTMPVPIPLDTAHLDLSSNTMGPLSDTMLAGPGYTTLVSLDLSSNQITKVSSWRNSSVDFWNLWKRNTLFIMLMKSRIYNQYKMFLFLIQYAVFLLAISSTSTSFIHTWLTYSKTWVFGHIFLCDFIKHPAEWWCYLFTFLYFIY